MIRLRKDAPRIAGELLKNDPDGRCDADVLVIGGLASPGVCVISKAGQTITYQKNKPYGMAGASLVYIGDELIEFDVVWTFWTEEQREAWKEWSKLALARPQRPPLISSTPLSTGEAGGTSVQPFKPVKVTGVYNPILAELGITAIAPTFIGQFIQLSIGKWQKQVSFIQHRPPKPALGRPNTTIPDVIQNSIPAKTAQELELEQALANVKTNQQFIANGYTGAVAK